jgi:hypothetical protein
MIRIDSLEHRSGQRLKFMFLGKPENARWAEPLLIPASDTISRQERPCARRAAILEASANTRGLPRRLPLGLKRFAEFPSFGATNVGKPLPARETQHCARRDHSIARPKFFRIAATTRKNATEGVFCCVRSCCFLWCRKSEILGRYHGSFVGERSISLE